MHTHTPNNNSLSDNSERKLKFKQRTILNALKMKNKYILRHKNSIFRMFFFAGFRFFSFFFAIFIQRKSRKIAQIPVIAPMIQIKDLLKNIPKKGAKIRTPTRTHRARVRGGNKSDGADSGFFDTN